MINITKEFLLEAGIVSMHITKDGKDTECFPEKGSDDFLVLKLPAEQGFTEGSEAVLSCVSEKEKSGIITHDVTESQVLISGVSSFYVTVQVEEKEGVIKKLFEMISFFEWHDKKYGRRKEERISVGKENYLTFGLSSLEQKVFSRAEGIIQPCAVVDASVHGICIVTPFENRKFRDTENFSIAVSFSSPEQTVVLGAHRVHIRLCGNRNSWAYVSCQLLEPVSHIWKERVIKMLEKRRNEGSGVEQN